MFRKNLTPSVVRRCAIFLALGGALVLNGTGAQGGLALERSSDDHADGLSPRPLVDQSLDSQRAAQALDTQSTPADKADAVQPITNPSSLSGPGLTGENWFQGLQDGVDQAFVAPDNVTPAAAPAQKDASTSLDAGVKANAIPSLPSFWSGLTCCIGLVVLGMFPRVRRALR